MPLSHEGILASTVDTQIKALINNLISIHDTTGEFLLRLDDGRVIDTKGWAGWEWTHGIGLYGLWHYHELTNDPAPLKIIEDWFRDRFAEGGTTKNINTMGPFLTLACVYERYGGEKGDRAHYKPWLEAWGEWAMWELERTEGGGMQHVTYLTPNTQQLWDDTLMMTALPLAKIGKVLNRPHYIAEAQKQFLLHIQYLQDPLTGLFFHGWEFTPTSPTGAHGHHFARALWGRGNSWLTIAIPEILSLLDLPPDDPFQQHLLTSLRMQLRALARHQDPATGLWRTILDHTDEASYLETSCAAGFAFGMLKAARLRLLPEGEREAVERMAVKAVKGVLGKIDERGELTGVSFGTPVFDTLQGYKDIPVTSMPYGQAMGMMALVEWLRRYI